MKELKSFTKGGIHPHDHKLATRDSRIREAGIPSSVVIPLHQHMGKPAACTVAVGDNVEAGMLIGEATGFFSANIFSSVPGTVKEITELYQPNGLKCVVSALIFRTSRSRSGKR